MSNRQFISAPMAMVMDPHLYNTNLFLHLQSSINNSQSQYYINQLLLSELHQMNMSTFNTGVISPFPTVDSTNSTAKKSGVSKKSVKKKKASKTKQLKTKPLAEEIVSENGVKKKKASKTKQLKTKPLAEEIASENGVKKKKASWTKQLKTKQRPEERVYIDQICDSDILCGRGGRTNKHIGNIRFRQVVNDMKAMYKNIEKKLKKTDLSIEIVDQVNNYGGRFIKKDNESDRYYLLTKAEARRKTSQALREQKEIKWTEEKK